MGLHAFGLLLALSGSLPAAAETASLPEQARTILRENCVKCHSGDKPRANLKVLNYAQLLNTENHLVVPNKPEDSELLQLVECGSMPPGTARKVPDKERAVLRDWIAQGAAAFPPRSSEPYILAQIQADVTKPGRDVENVRYFSFNHLLDDEAAANDLDVYRAALIKTLNLLSTKEKLVLPTAIDPERTIFRVALDELGWDKRPFGPDPKNAAKDIDPTRVNLYDLILLEYPISSLPDATPEGKALIASYLKPAHMLRPVPYLRGDWFVSNALQAPLYADLLLLPTSPAELEKRLGIETTTRLRAGLTESKYIRPDRILERGSSDQTIFWRTYDLEGLKGIDALLKVALDEPPRHGSAEMVFSLPNGLPGFLVTDASGHRHSTIFPRYLNKEFAGGGVRNALGCMQCHTAGLQPFTDVVNKNADSSPDVKNLRAKYPPLDDLWAADNGRFVAALSKLPGQPPDRYAVSFVAQQLARNPSGGLPPLDGASPVPIEPQNLPVKIELTATNEAGKLATVYHPGEKITFTVKNTGKVKLNYELVATDIGGKKISLGSKELEPDEVYTFGTAVGAKSGREYLTVYASEDKIPTGVGFKAKGERVMERYVHPLYKIADDNQIQTVFDPTHVVRKTITFETVAEK